MRLNARLLALEGRHSIARRIVTVFGANDDEHDRQIASVEAVAGKLHPSDLIVRIRRFGATPYQPPRINGRELETAA